MSLIKMGHVFITRETNHLMSKLWLYLHLITLQILIIIWIKQNKCSR